MKLGVAFCVPEYLDRLLDPWLAELVADAPGVMLVGPRGCGKTTSALRLANSVFRLDQDDTRATVSQNPDAVLADAEPPILVDEWQTAPNSLSAAKRLIDANPLPGRFLFTGSATDTLSGGAWPGTGRFIRVAMWGLTQREINKSIAKRNETFFDLLADESFDGSLLLPEHCPDANEYVDMALASGFPEARNRKSERTRLAWIDSYIDHLVGRDIELVGAVRNPLTLRRYLAAVAANTAGTPSLQSLITAASIDRETANRFDGLLERLFITEQVPAWTSNRLSRVSSTKKRYLCDPALVGSLIGLDRRSIVRSADLLGRIIDTFVASQIRPELSLGKLPVTMFHVRQDGRREIDLILERKDGALVAIEVKAGTTVDRSDARHLIWLRDQCDAATFRAGVLFYTGRFVRQLDERVWAIPICALWG